MVDIATSVYVDVMEEDVIRSVYCNRFRVFCELSQLDRINSI